MKLIKLFEPGYIKKLELKNRLVFPATGMLLAENGFVSQRLISFCKRLAEGGASLIVVGYCNIDPEPVVRDPEITDKEYNKAYVEGYHLCLTDDKFIPKLRELVQVVHSCGAKIGMQIQPATPPFGGSGGLRNLIFGKKPFRMNLTKEHFHELSGYSAEGVRRAKEAGFDLIEFAASGEALLGQTHSCSPLRNPMVKGYYEGREGRLRLTLESIKKVRDVVGPDYPLGIRFLAEEYIDRGYSLDESKAYAKRFEEAGLDFLNVAVAGHLARVPELPIFVPHGAFRHLTIAIREVVNIPIFASVRIHDAMLAEDILQNGEADFVNMCRPLFADPDLPNKSRNGQFDDIRPCIGCLECSTRTLVDGVKCAVNVECGQEEEMKLTPVLKKKKVVVVGGGPAGMEATRILKLRGHDVILYEKRQELGGMLGLAGLVPGKRDLGLLVKYLANQMGKLGVDVRCGQEATAAMIAKENPDAVIIAAGGTLRVPNISGLEKSGKVVSYEDVLLRNVAVGQKVVVIGGGGIGCETAKFIAKFSSMKDEVAVFLASWGAVTPECAISMANKSRKQVTIVSRNPKVGYSIHPFQKWGLIATLNRMGVEMIGNCEYSHVDEKGLYINVDGNKILLEADTIVLAAGSEPNLELVDKIKDKVPEVYVVGAAKEPRWLYDIMHEASRLARQI